MDRLPDELLGLIVNAIDEPTPPYQPSKTLASLCLVNRTSQRVTTPVLFENIVRAAPNYWHFEKRSIFYELLKTLRAQPKLRVYIKQLQDLADITPSTQSATVSEKGQLIPQPNGTEAQALIVALAEELQLPAVEDLVARHANCEDIWLTLCCLVAPNIERINTLLRKRLRRQPASNLLIECIGRSALGTPLGKVHSFDKLRYLHVEPEPGFMLKFPVTFAYPLLLLPKLETLILGEWGAIYENNQYSLDTNETTVFGRPWTWPNRESPVTELSIRDPHTTVTTVCNMIRACKNLVKYEGTNVEPIRVAGRPREWWYDHISSALHEHRTTLCEISIWEEFSPIVLPFVYGSLHSLQHMTCLARLRVPWQILLGYDGNATLPGRLPQSIQELTIELFHESEHDLEVALIDLHMQCAEGRFPALKQVHLIWRLLSAPMYFAFDVENVRDIYATGQIRFDITIHCSEGMSKSDNDPPAIHQKD